MRRIQEKAVYYKTSKRKVPKWERKENIKGKQTGKGRRINLSLY